MQDTITIMAGNPVMIPITYSPNVATYIWTPATGLSCTTCPQPFAVPKFATTYSVLYTDSNGCVNTDAIKVLVQCKNANLFMPNTFSPNADGSNDVFYPRGSGIHSVKTLRIFNRWGEIVFEKRNFPINDSSSGWNGTYKGNKPQQDVYIFQVEVYCENGQLITMDGNISLIL
jgi:gliding motility-associated-like protein